MKTSLTGFLVISLLFFGCRKPAQTGSTGPAPALKTIAAGCPDFFYFYNREKVALTILPKYLTVGFAPTTTSEEKAAILKTVPGYSKVVSENQSEWGKFMVIALKIGLTCPDVLQQTKALQTQAAVLFANPVFNAPAAKSGDYYWAGLTPDFLVTLKSSDDAGDFKALLTETNTRIIEKLGETSFILAADKNAKGNALEMANLFQSKEWVETAEPNFILSNRVEVGPDKK